MGMPESPGALKTIQTGGEISEQNRANWAELAEVHPAFCCHMCENSRNILSGLQSLDLGDCRNKCDIDKINKNSNIRSFIANHGRDNSYVYFIDFIVHELYHATQNIDLPRYVSDQEYYDMIETDCEYHSSLFMYNYMGWILSHLSVPLEVNFNLSETFHNSRKDRNAEEYANMLNDPWIIKM